MNDSISTSRLSFTVLRPLVALVALLWALPASSAPVSLAWDPSTGADVAGYLAYFGVTGSGTVQAVDVGTNTTYTFSNLVTEVSYTFHVTAYNSSRVESEPSDAIEYTPTAAVVPVTDTNAPVLVCPPNSVVTIPAGESSTIVTYVVTATDDVSIPTVTCTPPSGSTFAAGSHTVTCTATDAATNSSTSTFTIEVNRQPQAGAVTLGAMANLPRTASLATFLLSATDEDTDTLALLNIGAVSANGGTVAIVGEAVVYSPATNYVGADSFTYTVSDGRGGVATGTVSVTVWDKNDSVMNRISRVAATPQGATVYFTGIAGLVYTIERSTDLATSAWTSIGTVTAPTQGLAEFTDTTPVVGAAFYRTVTE